MKRLSKSRYMQFYKCQKYLNLNAYKPVKAWEKLKEVE